MLRQVKSFPLELFEPLQPINLNIWASLDDNGALGLVLVRDTPLAANQINRWLRFARVIVQILPGQIYIFRNSSVAKFNFRFIESDPHTIRQIFSAPDDAQFTETRCEKALLALYEFATIHGNFRLDGKNWLTEIFVAVSKADTPQAFWIRNAQYWLARWQQALGFEQRPAALASEVFRCLMPKLDRLAQRKAKAWFTPVPVADFLARAVADLLGQLARRPCIALEPAAGFGVLVEALLTHWPVSYDLRSFTAVESDELSVAVCRHRLQKHPAAEVKHQNWLADRRAVDQWLDQHRALLDEGHLIVIANPPWSGISNHMDSWLQQLILDYKKIEGGHWEERKHWLSDEYVKFIRLAQYLFERSNASGILAVVCSHSWLDNPTFRGLRQKLLSQFDRLYVIDLHGSKLKREPIPDETADENLFGIRQGACLLIAIKSKGALAPGTFWSECWGTVDEKLKQLASHRLHEWSWQTLNPKAPDWVLQPCPSKIKPRKLLSTSIIDLFQVFGSSVVTARDRFALADHPDTLIQRIETLRSEEFSDEELSRRWHLHSTSTFDLPSSRQQLREIPAGELGKWIRPILYRPFWWRYIFYHDAVVERRVYRLMRHLELPNLALVTVRRSAAGDPAGFYLAAQGLVCQGCIRSDNQSIDYIFPLWRYESAEGLCELGDDLRLPERVSNLRSEALFIPEQLYGLRLTTEQVFGYLYALVWSTGFRAAYAFELRAHFLRFSWVNEAALFVELAQLGLELARIHSDRLQLPRLPNLRFEDPLAFYNRPKLSYLKPLDSELLNFQIGSYKVIPYWVKKLNQALGHDPEYVEMALENVIHRLKLSLQIQREIDRLIPQSYWLN